MGRSGQIAPGQTSVWPAGHRQDAAAFGPWLRSASLGCLCLGVMACSDGQEAQLDALLQVCLDEKSDYRGKLRTCDEELGAATAALTSEGARQNGVDAPIIPLRARVRRNPPGPPDLEFSVKNQGEQAITGFRYRARFFNAFGERLLCDTSRHEDVPATCRDGAEELWSEEQGLRLEPEDREHFRRRPVYHFDGASRVIVTIYEVDFADGTTWRGASVGFPDVVLPRGAEDGDNGDSDGSDLLKSLRNRPLPSLDPPVARQPERRSPAAAE